jgi:DNA polymerase III subunit epsilon
MYAIVDIETTGGHAAANGITEIAIFIFDGNKITKQFETLINPQQIIPPYITSLTGISNAMVIHAPTFAEVAPTINGLLHNQIFVAHNVNFDFSFVKHHLKNAGFELKEKKLCTVRLARKVFEGFPSYSLGNLCRQLKINIDNRHRAGGDAKATVAVLQQCLANNGQQHIDAMLKKLSGEQWLPMHLTKADIKQLPTSPGVYYFHDSKGKIIYVGKAINIKKRVSSHFTHNNPDRKRQNFLRLIHKITFTNCATELQAIVLESTEIKRLWPKYNDSQKQPLQKYALYQFEDGRGYKRLAIDKKKKNLPALYQFNLLHEGQVMLKKMIEEFGLHQKLCYLDKTSFTAEELLALEKPTAYNKRISKALTALEKNIPTFAVVDDGLLPTQKLCLLIDRGSFWGMGYLPSETNISNAEELKNHLQPFADNDTIRNSIYAFVQQNPNKQIILSKD